MKTDNTPTVTARRRNLTPHMRLRLDNVKNIKELGTRVKAKRVTAAKTQKLGETDPEKMVCPGPRLPKVKNNRLALPEKPVSKFRKRQIHKSWLPTHIFHAKRAHMTEPKNPLWRFAIPLTPTDKAYRTTHRAGSLRGCVAWDTSYMSSIGLEGIESSLLGLLRCLGVGESALVGKREAKWRRGTRSWQDWVRECDGESLWIAPVRIVWCAGDAEAKKPPDDVVAGKAKQKRRLLVRIHPAAFLQLWNEILKVAKMQRPPVMVEDLRFEIGSIEIMGPGSTEALVSALRPILSDLGKEIGADSPARIWSQLGPVTNPAILPSNALLAFEISDPRLHHPQRTLQPLDVSGNDDAFLEILANWPVDTTQETPSISDRTSRLKASRLPSQKAINRRKGNALPGAYPDALSTDPQIPILLLSSRSQSYGGQGSWTMLCPWKCVLPIWYSLIHYPLASGGNPRFGGLRETRQIAFEQGVPWFPGDFPGTKAGWEWELAEREKRKTEWEKRPKGKRIEWESVDLGQDKKGEVGKGWACDWEFLFKPPTSTADSQPRNSTQTPTKTAADEQTKTTTTVPTSTTTKESPLPPILPPLNIRHLSLPSKTSLPSPLPPTALVSIHLTLLTRGVPQACARIYRLPSVSTLRSSWLSLIPSQKNTTPPEPTSKHPPPLPKNVPLEIRTQHLAAALLAPRHPNTHENTPLRAGDKNYPMCPGGEDLIGFVTTGNFNLGEGRGTGIGCLVLARVARDGKERGGLCIIRNAGEGVGRLARWRIV